jgi:hypothetical protein
MKKLMLILLIVIPFCSKAQSIISLPTNVVYVLDEKKVTKDQFNAVKSADIAEAYPLKGAKAATLYGAEAANGAFVIVTN